MYAVYFCGPTDCFLQAMFMQKDMAEEFAAKHGTSPEGFYIEFWDNPSWIDISDTGW